MRIQAGLWNSKENLSSCWIYIILHDADFKFIFIGTTYEKIEQFCQFNTDDNKNIFTALKTLFDLHIKLIRLFRNFLDDDFKVVVKANKTPVGQHERQ